MEDWPIFSIVSGNAPCTALLGTAPVRFWEDTVPETYLSSAADYAVWSTVGGAPENYMGETPTMDSGRIQVDVYARTKATARAIKNAIRDAIEPHAHMIGTPVSIYEPDTKRYRFMMEFQFWTLRPEPASV